MKKLKTVIIILFLFQSIFSFSQTKEETIQWLNDYGVKLMNIEKSTFLKDGKSALNQFKFLGCDGAYLTFIRLYQSKTTNNTLSVETKDIYKIALKSIFVQDISSLQKSKESGSLIIKTEINAVMEEEYIDGDVFFPPPNEDKKKRESNGTDIYISIFDEDKEEDAKRVIKAIIHLAKLSGAKELPKVTAKTF